MSSIIKNWSIEADVKGNTYEGQLHRVTGSMSFDIGGGHSIIFNGQNSMADRSLFPIPPGGQVTGIIVATFPDVNKELYDKERPTFKITFRDVLDREYTVSRQMSARTTPMDLHHIPYVPGIDQIVR